MGDKDPNPKDLACSFTGAALPALSGDMVVDTQATLENRSNKSPKGGGEREGVVPVTDGGLWWGKRRRL